MFIILFAATLVAVAGAREMLGSVMCGYQGWFGTSGGPIQGYGFRHWARENAMFAPGPGNADFDIVPDTSEYPPESLYPSAFPMPGGDANSTYMMFDASVQGVADLHAQWAQQYGIDGFVLQRFVSELTDPTCLAFRNRVTALVDAAITKHNRNWYILYDVSGADESTFLQVMTQDWIALRSIFNATSPTYMTHKGKPLVAIWGMGFTEHPPSTASAAIQVLQQFKNLGLSVLCGTPYHWRTSDQDSRPDFLDFYKQCDIISPWAVGRYNSLDSFAKNLGRVAVEDKRMTDNLGIAYVPVVFPGFSWSNAMNTPSEWNAIPRLGGQFFQAQASGLLSKVQPAALYVAMFDECNESTCIFKAVAKTADLPQDGPSFKFLALDADGDNVPNDHYLTLAGRFGTALRQLHNINEQ